VCTTLVSHSVGDSRRRVTTTACPRSNCTFRQAFTARSIARSARICCIAWRTSGEPSSAARSAP